MNPAACLISEKPFLGTLNSLCSSHGGFFSPITERTKSRQLCQVFAVYNCKDNSQTAMISQWIELSEFMAACVIIIIKQMHTGRPREKKMCFPLPNFLPYLNSSHLLLRGLISSIPTSIPTVLHLNHNMTESSESQWI